MANENIKQQANALRTRIFAICRRNGIDEDARHDIISAYTGGRTESLTGLRLFELRELVNRLSAMSVDTVESGKTPAETHGRASVQADAADYKYGLFDVNNKQHRTILSLVQSLGHNVWNSNYNRHVADLAWLGGWIKKYGKHKKPLLQQTTRELQVTIEQLGRVVDGHY